MNSFEQTGIVKNRFDEVTEFPDHLAFAEELLNKYEWEPHTQTEFKAQIDALRKKHDDRFLNLSVIGEFSTGKSTFLNALLRRDNFLESSSLQGTTNIATIIENSEKYEYTAVTADGKREEREFETVEELKECLANVSVNNDEASALYSVTIGLPAPLLDKFGFRIIDTPGINSNEEWHDDVTIRTIDELSDLSIIIIDATKPLPQQFCEFINENLQLILDQCVFVVTKVNMIRPKELEGVMNYIKDKAQKEFNIVEPLILPYSSTDILDNLDDLENPYELPELVKSSLNSEKMMLEHMSSQKSIVQTLNLISLADNMYEIVQKHLDTIAEKRVELLNMENRKRNIGQEFIMFLQNNNNDLVNDLYEVRGDISKNLTDLLKEQLRNFYLHGFDGMNQFFIPDDLVVFAEDSLPIIISDNMRKILYKINSGSKMVDKVFHELTAKFRNKFKSTFFDILDYSKISEEQFLEYIPVLDFMCMPTLLPITNYLYMATGKKQLLGTLIPKNNGMIGMGRDNIMRCIAQYLKDFYYKAVADIESYIDRVRNELFYANDAFVSQCKQIVNEDLENNNDEKIEEEIKSLKEDAERINLRKSKLDTVSRLLNIINRKER